MYVCMYLYVNGQFLFASFQQVPVPGTVGKKRIVDHVVQISRVRVFVAVFKLKNLLGFSREQMSI